MLYKLIICLLVVFRSVWTSGERGIPASVLPDISNLQQESEAFINRLNFFNLIPQEAAVVTCGDESTTNSVWQNPEYPKIEGGLPGLCTLSLTPPANTCALRINFDDLAFKPSFNVLTQLGCGQDSPSFKMSHSGGVTRGLCTDLTDYEGILELDSQNLEPTLLLLHLDPSKTFKFRVNITIISCNSITQYRSPNICGIKNDVNPASSLRSDLSSPNLEEEINQEEPETRADAIRSFKNRSTRQAFLARKKQISGDLRKNGDIISIALAQGVDNGQVAVSPTPVASRVFGEETGIGEWPWMVAIERRSDIDLTFLGIPIPPPDLDPCSGVLLDEQHVLTTASCVLSVVPLSSVKVSGLRALVGEHDLTTLDETLTFNTSISKAILPLSYDPFLLKEDLAILELTKPIDYQKTIRPICLPVDYNVFKTEDGLVSGWGVNPTGLVNALVSSDVKISNESACNQTLSRAIGSVLAITDTDPASIDLNDYICVDKGDDGSPVCNGDIGVPLVRRDQTGAYFLEGMSAPINTCGLEFPNIFTRITSNSTFLNLALA